MFRRKIFLGVAIVLVLGMLVGLAVGCSGKQPAAEKPEAKQGETKPAQAPPAEDYIPIGLLVGLTGDMAPWGREINNAAVLAVDEINAAGGPLGKKLKLFSEDNESTVEGAIRGARKLLTTDKVVAIIGPESDPIVALLDFAKENKIPVISTSGGTTALDKAGGQGKYIYRTNASDSFLGIIEAKLILDELKIKEVAVIYENLEGTTSAAEAFMRNFERFGGKILTKVAVTPGQATYLAELKKVFSTKPPLVYIAAGQVTGVTIFKEWYQRGFGGKWWTSSDLQTPDTIKAAGANVVEGIMSQRVIEPVGTETYKRFEEIYSKRFGEKPIAGYYQSNTYDAFIITALAIEAAGKATGEGIDNNLIKVANPPGKVVTSFEEGVKELRSGNDINFEGASGPVDFNQYGNVAGTRAAMMQVRNGDWVIVKEIDTSQFPLE